jgi:hypothetical protein
MTTKEAIEKILDVFTYEHKVYPTTKEGKKNYKYRIEKRIRLRSDRFTACCESNPLDYMHSMDCHPEDIIESRTDWEQMKDWCNEMGYALEEIGRILSNVDTDELDDEHEELLDVYQD